MSERHLNILTCLEVETEENFAMGKENMAVGMINITFAMNNNYGNNKHSFDNG